MKPAAFDYIAADSVDMAAAALADGGGRRQDHCRRAKPRPAPQLPPAASVDSVDINRHRAISAFISETATDIRVGALTRHYQLETSPVIARHLPVLACGDDARGASGDPQPRHHRRQPVRMADPAAELPMMALLLDAELVSGRLRQANASSRRAIFPRRAHRRSSPTTRSSPRSRCRNCRRETGWGFDGGRRAAAAISRLAAVAATLTLSAWRDRASAHRLDRRRRHRARACRRAEVLLIGQRARTGSDQRTCIDAVRAAIEPTTDLHAFAGLPASSRRRAGGRRRRDGAARIRECRMSKTRDIIRDGQRYAVTGRAVEPAAAARRFPARRRSASPARMSAASTACAAPAPVMLDGDSVRSCLMFARAGRWLPRRDSGEPRPHRSN